MALEGHGVEQPCGALLVQLRRGETACRHAACLQAQGPHQDTKRLTGNPSSSSSPLGIDILGYYYIKSYQDPKYME